ncbi:Guanylate-binding protein 6 [Galemys pyrenaicus]|uniref:Guanylate-binding protein 6 n=1 Tax=Galemys pyrenaicus TaxID=202257 RepID=A0A8J6AIN3_GALPY|nr:Guanylate-binding protein 6 [Galemys pyrenaicus]
MRTLQENVVKLEDKMSRERTNFLRQQNVMLKHMTKGDSKNDSWIFALAVLLSSSLVYNSMSTINNNALRKLHYVTELTELIRLKTSPSANDIEDSTEFLRFFPDFIWTVQDFTLELKTYDQSISEDEYLENALKHDLGSEWSFKGKNARAQLFNISRECIRRFSSKRKCFVFDGLYSIRHSAHIEDVLESQLDPKFLGQSDNFCSYLHPCKNQKPQGRSSSELHGYHQCGAAPCLENAVTTLAQLENSVVVGKAANHYSQQMDHRELLNVHIACEREATAIFMEHSFKDERERERKRVLYSSLCHGNPWIENELAGDMLCGSHSPVTHDVTCKLASGPHPYSQSIVCPGSNRVWAGNKM